MSLNPDQIASLRSAIEARRAELISEIREDVARLDDDSAADLGGEVRDAGDDSVAELIADVDRADIARDAGELRDIEAALARMESGDYGVCSDCGEEIAIERLRAQPTATRDVRCQALHEKTFAQPGRATL